MSDDIYLLAVSRFRELLSRAHALKLPEPSAMTLATVDAQGRPSVRTVLLKAFDARGFVFYTNLHSRKACQLRVNPWAALCFFWQPLMEQVLVEGHTEPVADIEADEYWATRPRISQIGAWASLQSEPLLERAHLAQRVTEFEGLFLDRPVPRPPHWSGLRLRPDMLEFWQSGTGRLHERERYDREQGIWRRTALYP